MIVTVTLILCYYKKVPNSIVQINSSHNVGSVVFFSLDNNQLLHLERFFTQNLNLSELNYQMYDKKY